MCSINKSRLEYNWELNIYFISYNILFLFFTFVWNPNMYVPPQMCLRIRHFQRLLFWFVILQERLTEQIIRSSSSSCLSLPNLWLFGCYGLVVVCCSSLVLTMGAGWTSVNVNWQKETFRHLCTCLYESINFCLVTLI